MSQTPRRHHVEKTTLDGRTTFVALVLASIWSTHSSVVAIGSTYWGKVGTERLPAEIDALPAMTDERLQRVQTWHAERYEAAYASIVAQFPDAADGIRRDGEITVPADAPTTWIRPSEEGSRTTFSAYVRTQDIKAYAEWAHEDGCYWGRVGSEKTTKDATKGKGFQAEREAMAYQMIERSFPEAAKGERSKGRIILDEAVAG